MTTVQARNGGIRLARKVAQSDIAKWKELRNEGHTYGKIGELVGWNAETIRKHIGVEEKIKEKEKKEKVEPETNLELQARAFLRFENKKGPSDLVKEKVCTANVAMALWEKFRELGGGSRLRFEKLEERINWLVERVCTLESACGATLHSEWKCPDCGTVGKVAVHYMCTSCKHESWWGFHPKPKKEPERLYKLPGE